MTHLEAKQEILKVDSRGRVRTPPERREALLDGFERSGLSGRRFAKMVRVAPLTFSAWVCQRRRKRAVAKKFVPQIKPVTLLEAVLEKRSAVADGSSGKNGKSTGALYYSRLSGSVRFTGRAPGSAKYSG